MTMFLFIYMIFLRGRWWTTVIELELSLLNKRDIGHYATSPWLSGRTGQGKAEFLNFTIAKLKQKSLNLDLWERLKRISKIK